MARRKLYFLDVYFTNYCSEHGELSPNLQIRRCAFEHRSAQQYLNGTWDQFNFYVGSRAYAAIKQWLHFYGATPTVYADGEISKHSYNLDWSRLDVILHTCRQEMEIK